MYEELVPRVEGTGLGSETTVSQSLDFGFRSGSLSTTTSAGAYAIFGMFKAGGKVPYTYGKQGGKGNPVYVPDTWNNNPNVQWHYELTDLN